MNYGELKSAVLEDTHREDLGQAPTNFIARFIREGEGMIRRELSAYILTTTIEESARSLTNNNQYSLPAGILVIRRIAQQAIVGSEVVRIALGAITNYPVSNRVAVYAEAGDGLIEIRGAPPVDTVFDLNYYGMPARLVEDEDTNSLLDENETLYKSAAMFYVYQHTQDVELATLALDVFNSIIETLNEEIARKIGGAQITASYQFGNGGTY